MKTIIPSFLIATAISLVLQTNYRLSDGIGVGEIGLALLIIFSIASCFATPARTPALSDHPLPLLALIYLLTVLLPVTALNTYYGTHGAEFRDLFAYLLCAFTTFALATQASKTREIAILTIGITIALVSLQYLFGDNSAWYSQIRFTGGAKNPNQLALYVVCLTLIAAIHITHPLLKSACIGILVFFGIASLSDAYLAYAGITLGILLLTLIIPSRFFMLAAPLAMILAVILGVWFLEDIANMLGKQWSVADEGGSRITLYLNGIRAWLDTPLSFMLGNGAGNFSGIYAPFQGSEAHSTPIDILSVGGLLGFVAIYFFPVKWAIDVYRLDQKLVFACTVGLIGFTLFHFVARHPIFWVTLFFLFQYIKDQQGIARSCVA